MQTRRRFLSTLSSLGAATVLGGSDLSTLLGQVPPGTLQPQPGITPASLTLLPLGSILPRGWLLRQMKIQAEGLSGHLSETWPDVGPQSAWLGGPGENGERGPYYLDGLLPLAHQLQDPVLKRKAAAFIEWTLQSQREDGMFGPVSNDDWWPRMVILKALTQHYEATADSRVPPFLRRYFQYQLETLPNRPLESWGKFRWQDEVLTVLWLYQREPASELLRLARMLHQQGHDWVRDFDNFRFHEPVTWDVIHAHGDDGSGDFALSSHGVNNGMAIKAGPVWSMLSGDASDRDAASRALAMLDTFHGLPNGMFSCDEHLAGRSPQHGSELCTVVETMFSLEQSLAITGDLRLADRLEVLAFNALPAAFTDDMWAHQYNQQSNQVECSVHSKPWTTDGPESNLFGLAPHFGCCTANYHQGWPKFTSSLFMRTRDDGLLACSYAPCHLQTVVRNASVEIDVDTEYPFQGEVTFRIKLAGPLAFPFSCRIPGWVKGASLSVNGAPLREEPSSQSVRIDRIWNDGDVVRLTLLLKARALPGNDDTVSIRRGALVLSLPIGEDWLELRKRGLTADWQVYPTTMWSYGMAATDSDLQRCELKSSGPAGASPFSMRDNSLRLTLPARKIPGWRAEDSNATDCLKLCIGSVEHEEEDINLVPYASAKLRITAFPLV